MSDSIHFSADELDHVEADVLLLMEDYPWHERESFFVEGPNLFWFLQARGHTRARVVAMLVRLIERGVLDLNGAGFEAPKARLLTYINTRPRASHQKPVTIPRPRLTAAERLAERLARFARDHLSGVQAKLLQLICAHSEPLPLEDIALHFRWARPYDDLFHNAQYRVNARLREHKLPFKIARHNNAAFISKASKKKAAKQNEKRKKLLLEVKVPPTAKCPHDRRGGPSDGPTTRQRRSAGLPANNRFLAQGARQR